MPGIFDFLMGGGQGGGLLGLGNQPMDIRTPAQQQGMGMPGMDASLFAQQAFQQPRGLLNGGGLMGGLNAGLSQIADPMGQQRQQAFQNHMALQQYELQRKSLEEKPQVVWQEDASGAKVPYLVGAMGGGIRQLPIQGAPPPAPGAPVIPPGADPKTFRVGVAKDALENKDLVSGGTRVLGMVDQLEKKVGSVDPATGKFVGTKEFKESTGPFVAALHDQPIWSPGRIGYEVAQSRANKTYLDTIKQDAQAVNSQMQRELLKGGGAITEDERKQVNKILSDIGAARSPEEAKKLLDNFRGLVRSMFKMDATPGAAPGAAPANSAAAPQTQKMTMPPNARLAPDGNHYVPDPNRPGKYLRVNP